MAQEERRRLGATSRQALTILHALRCRGVIEIPADAALAPGVEITPMEMLPWSFTWPAYHREQLLPAVLEELEAWPVDAMSVVERLRLWQELALTEAEAFFAAQLAKHGFDVGWASDLVFAQRQCGVELSIAQWRYCTWAATRHGASVALQQRPGADREALREAIFIELGRRAVQVGKGRWPDAGFPPRHPLPLDGFGLAFVKHLTGLRETFWTAIPAPETLLFPGRRIDSGPR
jgi:hypothetical protein